MIMPSEAPRSIGSLNGMASQVSLPSILLLHLHGLARLSRTRRGMDDALEQVLGDPAIGRNRQGLTGFGERGEAFRIERVALAARGIDPFGELVRRHRIDGEMHVGETVAAEL